MCLNALSHKIQYIVSVASMLLPQSTLKSIWTHWSWTSPLEMGPSKEKWMQHKKQDLLASAALILKFSKAVLTYLFILANGTTCYVTSYQQMLTVYHQHHSRHCTALAIIWICVTGYLKGLGPKFTFILLLFWTPVHSWGKYLRL